MTTAIDLGTNPDKLHAQIHTEARCQRVMVDFLASVKGFVLPEASTFVSLHRVCFGLQAGDCCMLPASSYFWGSFMLRF